MTAARIILTPIPFSPGHNGESVHQVWRDILDLTLTVSIPWPPIPDSAQAYNEVTFNQGRRNSPRENRSLSIFNDFINDLTTPE
jgi:hypothetical protein